MFHVSKLEVIFMSLRDIVVLSDNEMVITDMNKPAVNFYGWKADEVKGKSITFLIPTHPLDVPSSPVTLTARLASGKDLIAVIQATRDPHGELLAWTILPIALPHVYEFGVHINIRAALTPKLSISDLDFEGRRVFIRVDFNVPFEHQTGKIRDDSRIRAAIPTIKKIMGEGGRVIIGSHLGRPKKPNPKQSLQRILPRLKELLDTEVGFVPDVFQAADEVKKLKNGEVLLLENLRFFKGEDSKKSEDHRVLSRALASFSDIYVCDAFGTVHRVSASMTGIPRALGAGVTGYLIEKEIKAIKMVMLNPAQPLVAVIGGSKVSDKINILASIFNFAQIVVIGGSMAFTFLEAMGHNLGASKVERAIKEKAGVVDLHVKARELLALAKSRHVEIILPVDHSCATSFKDETPHITDTADVPPNYMALDYGPKTIALAAKAVQEARTLIWNGPVGVFEFPNFSRGTTAIAEGVKANRKLVSIVGGGDTAASTKSYRSYFTHVSTGGGAFLELLEGKALPGLVCLTARAAPKL
ncbi:unnamed protein product [Phytomonas sp. Hart1]|nr:unnamed protein product [Phytomonas sp. Hart1]|eukprot:CCW68183.1 unnamed protein product [Phytomonas sp. isolate Hart1]